MAVGLLPYSVRLASECVRCYGYYKRGCPDITQLTPGSGATSSPGPGVEDLLVRIELLCGTTIPSSLLPPQGAGTSPLLLGYKAWWDTVVAHPEGSLACVMSHWEWKYK